MDQFWYKVGEPYTKVWITEGKNCWGSFTVVSSLIENNTQNSISNINKY